MKRKKNWLKQPSLPPTPFTDADMKAFAFRPEHVCQFLFYNKEQISSLWRNCSICGKPPAFKNL